MFTYEQNFHPLHLSIHTISLFKMLNIKSRSSCPMEDRIEIIQVLLHLYSHWVIVRLFKSFRIPVGLQSTIGLGGCSLWTILYHLEGFPGGSVVQNPSANAGDAGFKLSIGKVPWRRKQLPTPAFLPGEPMDRGAWWATVPRVAKSPTQLKRLSMRALPLTQRRWETEYKKLRSKDRARRGEKAEQQWRSQVKWPKGCAGL